MVGLPVETVARNWISQIVDFLILNVIFIEEPGLLSQLMTYVTG
jgi:hypothetical protein